MFINAVLKKYPELNRPEGLFNIQNIADSYLTPNGETVEVNNDIYNKMVGLSTKPPYKTTWYEYKTILYDTEIIHNGFYLRYYDKEYYTYFLRTFAVYKGKLYPGIIADVIMDNFILPAKDFKIKIYNKAADSNDNKFNNSIVVTMLPIFFTNTLLNCKNVKTETNDFQLRRDVSHYKKIGKPYFEKYYTLKVKLPKQNNTQDKGENGGWSNAFHICRGHFKTYTQDAPLFGKFTGTYWWESTIRGSADVGVIEKDYKPVLEHA